MTDLTMTIIRRSALTLALCAPLCTMATDAGFAYTMEAQRMCSNDAFRLCAGEIPDVAKITACMIRHRADLSPNCRALMDSEMTRKPGNLAQQ